ncbi:MAG: lytic transglycosylase domain-containing protein [Pelotomaculum sp.]|nr:lytic transglycosylase domain-containing protein [Pelotomaculum sp.]
MTFRKRASRKRFKRRIFLLLVLILVCLNFKSITGFFYPFPYRNIITYYSGVYNLDPCLLAAVMKAESGFNRWAVSERGARGLMQIMPETGRWVASQMGDPDFDPDCLFDPETSIKLGAWYIADLKKEFGDNTVLVLAAYNGGRGNVKEWISGKELPAGKSTTIDQIPFPETRHYVRKVLLYYRIYSCLYG